jgi:hypothetical protein
LPAVEKDDFVFRVVAEDHLISSIKHKGTDNEYTPLNYYDIYLKQ